MRPSRSIALVVVVLGLSAALPTGAGAKAPRHTTKAPAHKATLIQAGHATFWECPAKTTGVLIGVNTLVLHPGQTLNINFIVRNEAAKTCDYVAPYAGVAPGPHRHIAPGRTVRGHRLRRSMARTITMCGRAW